MGLICAQVVLPYTTGLPRDVAINTFWFNVPEPVDGADVTEIANRLVAFYNDDYGGTKVADRMAKVIDRTTGACSIIQKLYPGPGDTGAGDQIDEFTSTWTLENYTTGTPLPLEVAVCCSFYGGGSEPARNRRGRVFVGPLNITAITDSVDQLPTVHAPFASCLAQAGLGLASATDADVQWVVYSRVRSEVFVVEAGWVDNEFDTQRRRQVEATARTSFAV